MSLGHMFLSKYGDIYCAIINGIERWSYCISYLYLYVPDSWFYIIVSLVVIGVDTHKILSCAI